MGINYSMEREPVYHELFISSRDKAYGSPTNFVVNIKQTNNLSFDAYRSESVSIPNLDYQLEAPATLTVVENSTTFDITVEEGTYSVNTLTNSINFALSQTASRTRIDFKTNQLRFAFFNLTYSFTVSSTDETLRKMLGLNSGSAASSVVGGQNVLVAPNVAKLYAGENLYLTSQAITSALRPKTNMTSGFNSNVIGVFSQGQFGSNQTTILAGQNFLPCDSTKPLSGLLDFQIRYNDGRVVDTELQDDDEIIIKIGYMTTRTIN